LIGLHLGHATLHFQHFVDRMFCGGCLFPCPGSAG
jgi:hypothetical protein